MKLSFRKSREFASRFRLRFARGPLILLYHRVDDDPTDPFSMCIPPHRFAEHLEILRKYGQPLKLSELIAKLHDDTLPRRAFCVTFDDGYLDNLVNAKPLLERHEVPATTFVATAYLGRQFWWDELSRLLVGTNKLPQELALKIQGRGYHWDKKDFPHAQSRSGGSCQDDSRPFQLREHRVFRSLYRLLKPLSFPERQEIIENLRVWSGINGDEDSLPRGLSPNELLKLTEGDMIEIGAHTHTHPVLSTLSIRDQCREIRDSKSFLEEITDRPVNRFAYPFGHSSDYTFETTGLLKTSGFSSACSNFADKALTKSRLYELPRLWIGNIDSARFDYLARKWLAG